jgi:hypothetical protein
VVETKGEEQISTNITINCKDTNRLYTKIIYGKETASLKSILLQDRKGENPKLFKYIWSMVFLKKPRRKSSFFT